MIPYAPGQGATTAGRCDASRWLGHAVGCPARAADLEPVEPFFVFYLDGDLTSLDDLYTPPWERTAEAVG